MRAATDEDDDDEASSGKSEGHRETRTSQMGMRRKENSSKQQQHPSVSSRQSSAPHHQREQARHGTGTSTSKQRAPGDDRRELGQREEISVRRRSPSCLLLYGLRGLGGSLRVELKVEMSCTCVCERRTTNASPAGMQGECKPTSVCVVRYG